MSNFDSDSGSDGQWEDRGDLAWNEFDWERYLREQDEAVHRYLRFYEACSGEADRIDAVAEKMGWGEDNWSDENETSADEADDSSDEDFHEEDVYTLHKNPIFIATKGSDGKWAMETAEVTNRKGKLPYILAFAQDNRGEVYALTSITTGPNGSLDTIYRIVPAK